MKYEAGSTLKCRSQTYLITTKSQQLLKRLQHNRSIERISMISDESRSSRVQYKARSTVDILVGRQRRSPPPIWSTSASAENERTGCTGPEDRWPGHGCWPSANWGHRGGLCGVCCWRVLKTSGGCAPSVGGWGGEWIRMCCKKIFCSDVRWLCVRKVFFLIMTIRARLCVCGGCALCTHFSLKENLSKLLKGSFIIIAFIISRQWLS